MFILQTVLPASNMDQSVSARSWLGDRICRGCTSAVLWSPALFPCKMLYRWQFFPPSLNITSPAVELGSSLALYSNYQGEVKNTIISKLKNGELDKHNVALHWNKDGTLEFYGIFFTYTNGLLISEMLRAAYIVFCQLKISHSLSWSQRSFHYLKKRLCISCHKYPAWNWRACFKEGNRKELILPNK